MSKRTTTALLLSLKPKYAAGIYNNIKKYEFRRICPVIDNSTVAYIYESAPHSMVTGFINIKKSIHADTVELLNLPDSSDPFIEDYERYLSGATKPGVLVLAEAFRWEKSIKLQDWTSQIKRPPQSYCYIDEEKIAIMPPLFDLGLCHKNQCDLSIS